MKYTFSIRHYQPEIEFLKHKSQSRLCSQSSACFVVDMTDHCSVRAFYAPENFFADKHAGKLEMTGDEKESFLRSLEIGKRFYLFHRGKPFLVFTDWLKDTGLLLIISPDADAIATKKRTPAFSLRRILGWTNHSLASHRSRRMENSL